MKINQKSKKNFRCQYLLNGAARPWFTRGKISDSNHSCFDSICYRTESSI